MVFFITLPFLGPLWVSALKFVLEGLNSIGQPR
jgi:hypothetical protein